MIKENDIVNDGKKTGKVVFVGNEINRVRKIRVKWECGKEETINNWEKLKVMGQQTTLTMN